MKRAINMPVISAPVTKVAIFFVHADRSNCLDLILKNPFFL